MTWIGRKWALPPKTLHGQCRDQFRQLSIGVERERADQPIMSEPRSHDLYRPIYHPAESLVREIPRHHAPMQAGAFKVSTELVERRRTEHSCQPNGISTALPLSEYDVMSIFGSIMSKIFGAAPAAVTSKGETPAASQASAPASAVPTAEATPAATPAAAAPPSTVPVDVVAVLTEKASAKGGGGNWQTSIVDLLKLLDLDSSLNARKELGAELNVHAGADGSAQQNIALHRAVMKKLAENGGKVPESLRS